MEELQIFEELVRLKRERIPAALAIVIDSTGSAPRKAGAKLLIRQDGSTLGTVGGGRIEAETVAAARSVMTGGIPGRLTFKLTEEHGFVCGGEVQIYVEPVKFPPQLVAIGAGHIGQALARAARQAGFAVTLVDPHPEEPAAASDGFAPADLAGEVTHILSRLPVDRETCILIATRGHRDDFLAVRAALATDACYIGLVGSRRKRSALQAFLAEAGLPAEAFARVTTPAGLDIGAQTPEEIAVSILAQLIQTWRNHAAEGLCDRPGCRPLAADGALQAAAAAG
ncbi:MAG TPA: XdhC family protein [Desulfuromonadales bacterium]